VTLVEAADHALPAEEPENGEAMDQVIRSEGMALHTGAVALAVRRDGRVIAVDLSDGTTVEGERLLVATGRPVDLRGLGVEAAGLDSDAPAVATDANLRAGDGIWAVGDVTARARSPTWRSTRAGSPPPTSSASSTPQPTTAPCRG
jgi:pyruvate/2-oxoglutarate dehydrogenase complex dihydrolipoamide dehydrogenase (E3) component